ASACFGSRGSCEAVGAAARRVAAAASAQTTTEPARRALAAAPGRRPVRYRPPPAIGPVWDLYRTRKTRRATVNRDRCCTKIRRRLWLVRFLGLLAPSSGYSRTKRKAVSAFRGFCVDRRGLWLSLPGERHREAGQVDAGVGEA